MATGHVFLKRKQSEVFARLRAHPVVIGGMILTACTPEAQDDLARDAARATLAPILVDRFPGLPVEPALNCILNNADAAQINALAVDTLTGANAATVEIVSDIVSRPRTQTCLAAEGLRATL